MNKKSISDIDVYNKRVLLRCDFNVPLDGDRITDQTRIKAALPTIKYLIEHGAKVVICSHLGRPKGKFDNKYSLSPVAKKLSELLGQYVKMAKDVVGESARSCVKVMEPGGVVLLENLRFHSGEEENDPGFCEKLSSLADIFVNDAFGTAHRAHASTEGVARYLRAVSGFLIQKEIEVMGSALNNPEHPFVAILGGAKVSDKINIIKNLLEKADVLIIGGGMAYTFFKAQGYEIGKSICEDDKLELAASLLEKSQGSCKILLPCENVIAREFKADSESKSVKSSEIPADWMGMDIGWLAIKAFVAEIEKAKTVIWNGPMGVFEFDNFANGTREVARAVSEVNGVTIVGGGDSVAAIVRMGFAGKVTHISTGGGASMEFLEGSVLPGIACLEDK